MNLGSIAYLGLCAGALIWGGVADKVGRRHCLLICLSMSAFFSVLSAFSQGIYKTGENRLKPVWTSSQTLIFILGFGIFLFCRLGSSLGIGGAVPAAYALYAEFLPREKRAEHLSWLCLSWVVGGVYAAAMAWAVIPNTGWGFSYGSNYEVMELNLSTYTPQSRVDGSTGWKWTVETIEIGRFWMWIYSPKRRKLGETDFPSKDRPLSTDRPLSRRLRYQI